jgi:predicted AlkP superfamily pyrophosphatase or phosphodiesterase
MKVCPALLALLLAVRTLAAAPPTPPPKLVVAILVDQLRYDYLERFHHQFSENGFRLLTDRGAFMTFARYNYMPTITGPGHASFFSGAPPAIHGIIGNDWFDKRTLKNVYCVGDSTVTSVGTSTAAGQMSPRQFIGGNVADQMRLHYQSKVIAVAMKDRGAVLPGGKKPAGAYWWENSTGNFITSSYYRPDLPEWVRKFNSRNRAAEFIGQKWQRLRKPEAYERGDDLPGEGINPGGTAPVFDHTVAASKSEGFENIMPTPFGNQLLLEFAKAALEGEDLGRGPQPDLFCVSFASVDFCGHRFGPYSQEIQDIVLRLDLQLAELLAAIDKKVGLANVAIVLTADHGVAPATAFASSVGLDGQNADMMGLMEDLVGKLSERFGSSKVLLTPRLINGNFFYNHSFLREKGIAADDLSSFIREWALSTGYFQAGYSREQILDGRTPGDFGELVRNGFNAARSGDMVLVLKPYTLAGTGRAGTTHGSPYSYDTHIPVCFYGAAFLPGRYADEFYITDIAATLSAALHIDPPAASIGKPFVKVLAEQPENAARRPAPAAAPKRR